MQPEERAEQCIQNGRHEGKRPLWGHKHRWDENIRITVQKIGWGHKLDLNGSEYGPMEDLYKDGYETLWSIQEGWLFYQPSVQYGIQRNEQIPLQEKKKLKQIRQ